MFRQIDEIRETIFKYLESRLELIQIDTRDKFEQVILKLVYLFLGALFIMIVLLLVVIMISIGLNIWLGSSYAGYLIILMFFIILTTIWFAYRPKWLSLLRLVANKIVQTNQPSEP
jgi:phosphoglycerol transferase MdoB-like AlkP superfamily enzyme